MISALSKLHLRRYLNLTYRLRLSRSSTDKRADNASVNTPLYGVRNLGIAFQPAHVEAAVSLIDCKSVLESHSMRTVRLYIWLSVSAGEDFLFQASFSCNIFAMLQHVTSDTYSALRPARKLLEDPLPWLPFLMPCK